MSALIERVQVPSESAVHVDYRVTLVGSVAVACTCPHFNHRATDGNFTCKHMDKVNDSRPLTAAELARVRTILNRGV